VLDLLPPNLVLDGELVVLDGAGRPLFNKLLFGDHRPTYVAFDLLIADGIDLRPLPLSDRKARLAQIAKRAAATNRAEGWIALSNGVVALVALSVRDVHRSFTSHPTEDAREITAKRNHFDRCRGTLPPKS